MSGYADVISSPGMLDPDVRFIRKPFDVDDFVHEVSQALRDIPASKKGS